MFGIYGKTIKKVLSLLPRELKKKLISMQLLIIFTSFLDLLGLVIFIPILSAISTPEILATNRAFVYIKSIVYIEDTNYFLLFLFLSAFFVFLIRSVFIYFSIRMQNKFIFKINEYIGVKTYEYYLGIDYQKFNSKDAAEIIRELTISPSFFARFLITPLFTITSEALIIIIITFSIAMFDIKAFLLLVVLLFPIAFLFQKLIKRKLNKLGIEENRLNPIFYNNSQRGINGYVDAKLKHKEIILINDYLNSLKQLNQLNITSSTLSILPAKIFEIIAVSGLILIFCYSVFLANSSSLVIPLITVFSAAVYRVLPSLSKIMPSFMQLEQYAYLFDVFHAPLTYSANEKKYINNNSLVFTESIKLKDASFTFYNQSNSFINNLSITLNKGEVVGFIGKSGSGKTSVVNLLAGIYKLTSGKLLVDNTEVTGENMRSWQKKISYIQQNPYIEKGTLASNIAFLDASIDNDKLLKSIEMASLSDFVGNQNPNEIKISENGKNLSGGQKQRIIIARALYNEVDLIIMDEATSALDKDTEIDITESIKKIKGTGLTIIIIAHRYSTLKYTDRIFEFKNGSLIAETHYSSIS